MATSKENLVKNVLLGTEHDDKFPLETPSAILARQVAKFILDAERSIVHSFCQCFQSYAFFRNFTEIRP